MEWTLSLHIPLASIETCFLPGVYLSGMAWGEMGIWCCSATHCFCERYQKNISNFQLNITLSFGVTVIPFKQLPIGIKAFDVWIAKLELHGLFVYYKSLISTLIFCIFHFYCRHFTSPFCLFSHSSYSDAETMRFSQCHLFKLYSFVSLKSSQLMQPKTLCCHFLLPLFWKSYFLTFNKKEKKKIKLWTDKPVIFQIKLWFLVHASLILYISTADCPPATLPSHPPFLYQIHFSISLQIKSSIPRDIKQTQHKKIQ